MFLKYIFVLIVLSRIFSIILHCSINSCFWEGVGVACQTVLLFPASLCHSIPLGKRYSTLVHSFGGLIFINIYIYIYIFASLSRISSIILHCSINPCFWEGVDVACQTLLLLSCIALSCHTTREKLLYPYSLLWEGFF